MAFHFWWKWMLTLTGSMQHSSAGVILSKFGMSLFAVFRCSIRDSENHSAVEHVTNSVGGPRRFIIHLMSMPSLAKYSLEPRRFAIMVKIFDCTSPSLFCSRSMKAVAVRFLPVTVFTCGLWNDTYWRLPGPENCAADNWFLVWISDFCVTDDFWCSHWFQFWCFSSCLSVYVYQLETVRKMLSDLAQQQRCQRFRRWPCSSNSPLVHPLDSHCWVAALRNSHTGMTSMRHPVSLLVHCWPTCAALLPQAYDVFNLSHCICWNVLVNRVVASQPF